MDFIQPIDQSTALSSFPVIKETRVNKMASNGSMSTNRSSTRLSSGSISETSRKLFREISNSSDRSAKYSLEQRRADNSNQATKRYKSTDNLKLETDRESVIHLAKFLRTTDPPANNFMSLPDGSHRRSQNKKLPFKMLRRQTSKKSSNTVVRTLRLPDSAVAAKTSQGHWHIAISIPVGYDHEERNTPSQSQTTKHAKTQSETAIRNGPITVLKPAIGNVRPAALQKVHIKSQSHDDLRLTFASPKRLSVSLPSNMEAGHSSQALSDQKHNQDVSQSAKVNQVQSSQPFTPDNAVSAGDAARPKSQRSEARKSEETFTVRSLDSSVCHTRGQSSISTAPSVNYPASPRAIWPPKRQTSASYHVLDQSEQSISAQLRQSVIDSYVDDCLRPTSAGSDMSSANLNIAATAQGYGPDMPGTQVVFVRKGTQAPSYRARIARRTPKNSSAEYILSSQSTLSRDYSAGPPNGVDVESTAKTRQSRRDRVKAIRSRDMAKLRAMKKYEQVMASVTANEIPSVSGLSPSNGARTESYRRQAQKRSLSYASIAEETPWQKTLNSLTSVMVVADLEPSTASSDLCVNPNMLVADFEPSVAQSEPCIPVSHLSTQVLNEKEKRISLRNSPDEAQTPPCSVPASPTSSDREVSLRNSPDEAQTPPRSTTPSPASSDTETVRSLRPRPRTSSATNSQRYRNVSKHQVDLRRQKSMPDESMDVRMRRLETINAVIFRTLNAVVEMGVGFRELRQLLPADSIESHEAQFRIGYANQTNEDRDPVGSLIRELRGAVKIGQEELAKYGATV